jgi:hypothetical protein
MKYNRKIRKPDPNSNHTYKQILVNGSDAPLPQFIIHVNFSWRTPPHHDHGPWVMVIIHGLWVMFKVGIITKRCILAGIIGITGITGRR